MLRRPNAPVSRATRGVLTAAAVAMLLTACSPTPNPSTNPEPAESAPAATEAPEAPAYDPAGTAEANLPVFTAVTQQVWASEQRASGRAYVDALVAVGFDRALMQVTPDETTVGNAVESLQFSVRWGDAHCLIGQVGPSTGEPVTAVMAQLAEGRCLVGTTRPIDW
ncbi:DUF6993 domain-containing protein [Microbacterium aurantiacum]|uniref:DUF6993 domain-containing protein n=1 Tax=Microbacterium aurantiacum TaxID=162393 RepID=UPI0015E11D5C|nr:hypothetical protein [Microbacterium aurantiacum]